jgi:PAS domain S-box-containing protein
MVITGLHVNGAVHQHSPLEAQLQATLNILPAYAWYASPHGALRFVNQRTADYLGLPKDHPLRFGTDTSAVWDSHIPLLHADDRHETRRVWSDCLRTGCAGEVSFRVRNAKGGYRWFLSRAEPVRAAEGALLYWIGVNLDIEERKQAEFQLRRSKAHLADAQSLSRTGCVGMERNTKRIFWSEEAARIYGYSPGTEPTPDLILQRAHPDDVGLVKDALERAAQNGGDLDYEHRLLMPDGSIKHLHDLAHRVRDEEGNEEVVGAIMDITERKVAEEAIRRSEAYLAEAQRLSHTGSFGWKPDTGEIVWSAETYRIFEYDRSVKPTLDSVGQRVHPQDRADFQKVIDRASQGATDFEHTYRLLLPDGRIKHVHTIAHDLHDASGSHEFVGGVTDITEQRQAQAVIREQETELRQMLDFAPQLIAVYGPNRERLHANRVALDYAGLNIDEWRQTEARGAFIHPDDREQELAYFARARSDGSAGQLELRLRGGDGSYRWFLARYNSVRDNNGQILRWYVSCTDIEDRKRAEERLQQENVALREEIDKTSMFEEIVGTSPALQTVLSRISKVAPTDSTVLITGET